MTVKLSPQKLSTILRCYFAGVSQPNIAKKVAVDQSTVSLYSSRFQVRAAETGLLNAAKEFGIMKEVNDLRSLGVELLKNKLTVEESRDGLVILKIFNNLGVPASRYKYLVEVISKLDDPGFLPAAMELVELEANTGKSYTQVVSEFHQLLSEMSEIEQNRAVLLQENDGLYQSNKELSAAIKEKQKKFKDLKKKVRQQVSAIKSKLASKIEEARLTLHRIEKLEALLAVLNKLLVSDEQLEQYLSKHVKIEESGISWENFIKIVEASELEGSQITSEKLTEDLARYISLTNAIGALEEQKSILEPDIHNLSDERNGLEASVEDFKQQQMHSGAKLKSLNKTVTHLSKRDKLLENKIEALENEISRKKSDMNTLEAKRIVLKQEVTEYEQKKTELAAEVESMEETAEYKKALDENIADLKITERKLQAKTDSEAKRLEVLDAFLGLVHATNRQELQIFARVLPEILEESSEKGYSTRLLFKYIISQLSGKVGNVLSCDHCSAEFVVNKQVIGMTGYRCPACGSLLVSTKIELSDVLGAQLYSSDEKKISYSRPSIIRLDPQK